MDWRTTIAQAREYALVRIHWVNVAFILGLFLYGVAGGIHYQAFNFLHGVDLLIHEFGHMFFGIFGAVTLTVLGGSILQIAMPVAFTVYFARRQQYYSASAVLFWVAQNFFDVAVYVRDARALQLPLVGIGGDGDEIIHDWNFLLDRWHLLIYDQQVANMFAAIGWLLLLVSVAAGLFFSLEFARRSPETEEPAEPQEIVCTDFLRGHTQD